MKKKKEEENECNYKRWKNECLLLINVNNKENKKRRGKTQIGSIKQQQISEAKKRIYSKPR